MNLKKQNFLPKFSFKKVAFYLNIFLVILFLLIFCFIGTFVNKNVYKVISIDDEIIIDQVMMNSLIVNLDVDNFEKIIENIEKKSIPRKVENFKDIFE